MGLFTAAFPFAGEEVLGKLHGPLTLMVLGSMLRSVAFESCICAVVAHKMHWVGAFYLGLVMTALSYSVALGHIVINYQTMMGYDWFVIFIGLCAVATYVLLGSAWLVMRVAWRLAALRCAVGAPHSMLDYCRHDCYRSNLRPG